MDKSKEWWIRPNADYSREFVWPMNYEYMEADDKVHVIEYSAYLELKHELEKCREPNIYTNPMAQDAFKMGHTAAEKILFPILRAKLEKMVQALKHYQNSYGVESQVADEALAEYENPDG